MITVLKPVRRLAKRLHSFACASSMPAIRLQHERTNAGGRGNAGGLLSDGLNVVRGEPGETQLAISGVSKHFGGVRAVESVTLSVRRGELVSIIGPNGAGKTSLLNMISGFYRPDAGSLAFDGRDITGLRPSQIAALGIARTFQNIALFSGMTVLDNIMLGRHVRMKAGVFSSLVYWGLAQKEEVAHRARVEELIEFLELADLRKQPTSGLAYGL